MKALLPPGWPRPKGYSNGISASGHLVLTAGVIGWGESERLVSDDLPGQFRQVLVNTPSILKEGRAGPEKVVRMTYDITDRDANIAPVPEIGAIYLAMTGPNNPTKAGETVG